MTTDQDSLREQYDALQSQWRQLAIEHEHHYLQYLATRAPVDFVLVAKMTSINEQAATEIPPGEYPAIPPPGFNLLVSLGDLILNYGAHRHLCKPGETYYLTRIHRKEVAEPTGQGMRGESKRR